MFLIIPDSLPAAETLQKDNIFTMEHGRAMNQDIRPLKIVIVNLMPTKIATETARPHLDVTGGVERAVWYIPRIFVGGIRVD